MKPTIVRIQPIRTVCDPPIIKTSVIRSVCHTPFVKASITKAEIPSKRQVSFDCILPLAKSASENIADFTHEFLFYDSGCDKYDYAMAAFSGVVSGLIDSFFIQSPLYSPLGNITDQAVDKMVIRFAQWVFSLDEKQKKTYRKMPSTIAGAIGFLENRFRTNYDARYGKDLIGGESLARFCPGNHHLKSLAHCPDIVVLYFSIFVFILPVVQRRSTADSCRMSRVVPVLRSQATCRRS